MTSHILRLHPQCDADHIRPKPGHGYITEEIFVTLSEVMGVTYGWVHYTLVCRFCFERVASRKARAESVSLTITGSVPDDLAAASRLDWS